MGYGVNFRNEIVKKCGDKNDIIGNNFRLSYKQGLEAADMVREYLNHNEGIKVSGPMQLSSTVFEALNHPGEWTYHVRGDTTLYVEMRGVNGWSNHRMKVQFGAAGPNAEQIIGDIEAILSHVENS